MPTTSTRRKHRTAEPREEAMPTRDGALGIRLLTLAREGRGGSVIVHVVASEDRVDRIARLLWQLAPATETIPFPGWDCLPYDRTSPSSRVEGLRTAALAALAEPPSRPRIVVASPAGLLQRVPPPEIWSGVTLHLENGAPLVPDDLRRSLAAIGYREDERVDEPGEFAVRGKVVDVFPAGYGLPVRIDHADGRVIEIASYDAASQRSTDRFDTLALRPVTEAVRAPGTEDASPREPGAEHRLAEYHDRLVTLFDYLPGATIVLEPGSHARTDGFLDLVADAYESRGRLGGPRPLPTGRLYLPASEREERLVRHPVLSLVEEADDDTVPHFVESKAPGDAMTAFVRTRLQDGWRVVLASMAEADRTALARRCGGVRPRDVAGWQDVEEAEPGSVLALRVDLDHGFLLPDDRIAVVSASDLLGSRAHGREPSFADDLFGEEEFHLGDAVIHLDHGVGLLRGIETVEAGETGPTETIRLEYHGGAVLMVPADEIDAMWRYGRGDVGLTLDRLGGDSWPKRRAKVESEINAAARDLARLAAERAALSAPRLVPDRQDYERFVARCPFEPTADQRGAVDAILGDLASGHAMDRLICGDVGFGKTEVALRAAAAAAFAGKQVAIVAPTTVLVRQHLQTVTRRFADLGIAVGHLSRLVSAKEAKDVKAKLRSGEIRIVVGTHALAAKDVAFADLGLLVIDEEQRFGAADKEKLRAMGSAVHVLTLTATPIPRTLQTALVGLQEVSVLRTPPAERQPVRTVVAPFDEGTVRAALLREKGRGGQSFVVVPRVSEIGPLAKRLAELVPELDVAVAHGKLPADEIDATMVRFADAQGDVLLATNIIESGLDVPRANTMIVVGADKFGLGQLHQLRGRVGRGRLRGVAHLTTDPEAELPDTTRRRLETLETLDRLGAGFAISAEDLEERGAGDLLGDSQAGHVKLIGSGLYRRLLERALLMARGEAAGDAWSPQLHLGLSGHIPPDYVAEPDIRLNLYARIARLADKTDETRLAEELDDRFGPPPAPVTNLLALARLRRHCRASDVARVDAGPQAIALTFKTRHPDDSDLAALIGRSGGRLVWKKTRLVAAVPTGVGPKRLAAVEALVAKVGRPVPVAEARGRT